MLQSKIRAQKREECATPTGSPYPDTEPQEEQQGLDAIYAALPGELAARSDTFARAEKTMMRAGGEAGRVEVARRARGLLLQAERVRDGAAPYFARIRGRFRDGRGEDFAEDVRVSGFPYMEAWLTPEGELVAVSQWAGIAELARDPAAEAYQAQDGYERARGLVGKVDCLGVKVEDVEIKDGRVTRVAPRYGEVWRERVRGRLLDPGNIGIGQMWDVLDQDQMRLISRRDAKRRLLTIHGPAGTGKTVVALHYVGLQAAEEDGCLYVVPTPALARHVELGLRFTTRAPERWRVLALWEVLQELCPEAGPYLPEDEPTPLAEAKTGSADAGVLPYALAELGGGGPPADLLRAYWGGVAAYCRAAGKEEPIRRVRREDVPALMLLALRAGRRQAAPRPRWVIVDEAQAYPPLAYAAIHALAGNGARFVVAGDPNQRMGGPLGLAEFDHAREALGLSLKAADTVVLQSVYRTPRAIHALGRHILGEPAGKVTSLHDEEGETQAVAVPRASDVPARIAEEIVLGSERGLRMAVVIAPGLDRARQLMSAVAPELRRRLGSSAPSAVQLLDGADGYRGALAFGPLEAMQGLEADLIIVADADASAYPGDEAGAHRLYTAVTRARKRVVLVAAERLTPLLG